MKLVSLILSTMFLFCNALLAMENLRVYEGKEWGYMENKNNGNLEKCSSIRIVIGHTVTKKNNSIESLKAIQKVHMDQKWVTIGYNLCLDDQGYAYKCRDKDVVPAFVLGKNRGTFAIGLIGNYQETEVTEHMVAVWSAQIAAAAKVLGIKKLSRGQNIFDQCEYSIGPDPEDPTREVSRFPESPGQHFMKVFDDIILRANLALAN